MSLRAQVALGLKWQAIMIVGRQLLSLVIFGILARLLDPTDFGLMGLTYVYLMLTNMLTDQGLSTALIQRVDLQKEHWDTAFWFNIACALFLCAGTIICANPIAILLGEADLAPLLRWSSTCMIFSAVSAVTGTKFAKELDFRQPALRTLVAHLIGGGIGIGMALSGFGIWALVGQQVTTSFAGMIFLWIVSKYRPAFRFSFSHLRDLFPVSSSVFLNTLIWFFTARLDQLVIGRFAGAGSLGLYVVAGKIPEILKTAGDQAIAEVSMPALSKLQGDHGRMRQAIHRGMGLNAVVMFAIFVGLAAVATDLVPLLFGAKWAAASDLCSLLSVLSLSHALGVFIYPALLAAGLGWKYVGLGVSYALGVLVACLVGIQFGVTQLVIALIVNSLVQAVPCFLLLHRQIGLGPLLYYKPCLAPACASLFMVGMIKLAAAVVTSGFHPWLRLSCHVMVGAAAYLGFLQLFSRAAMHELVQIASQALRGVRRVPDILPT
jgi:O-antigen/teichoic acid export membrane protein